MKLARLLLTISFVVTMSCQKSDNPGSYTKDVSDAERALFNPWFYLGEWRHTPEDGGFRFAAAVYQWDESGRIQSHRLRLLNDETLRHKKVGHSDTLDFLRDKIKYVDENNYRYVHKSIDVIFTRITTRVPQPPILTPDCNEGGKYWGTCAFYDKCLDKSIVGGTCGPTGYPLGYGKKYCEGFTELAFNSPYSNQWRDRTRTCLQRELRDTLIGLHDKRYTCGGVYRIAFDSHPSCYLGAGGDETSVCLLRGDDLPSVVGLVDISDLTKYDSLFQIAKVAKPCLNKLGWLIQQPGISPERREYLARQLELWRRYVID